MARNVGLVLRVWLGIVTAPRMRFRFCFLVATIAATSPLLAVEGATTAVPSPAVKLAIVISVDQMRADYLVRFRPYFGEGGFKRLLDGGLDFQDCHYRHALTQTAPGHATMATGVHPATHGIISNEWVDPESWEIVNNVEDRAAPLVGLSPEEAGPVLLAAKAGRSPRNLRATTVGDQLKMRFGENAKVFAASNKDRSAILLGGKLADAAYWDERGRMVTSTYYRAELPAWVAAFNAERRVEADFGKRWDRLLDARIYDAVQGPDDAPGEATDANGLGRTFPKVIDGGAPTITGRYYGAYDNTPFSSEFLGEFVQRAVREERLGRHAATDLLCVSFSQIDSTGHAFGPDSHEIMDAVLRLDRVLAALLDFIDAEVGLKHCLVVLSADHGVSPLPERVRATRPEIPAGRIEHAEADRAVRKALDDAFGALPEGEVWFIRYNNGYHLRPSALVARNVRLGDAANVMRTALRGVPFVAHAFTREEIVAAPLEGDSILAMVRRSYFPAHDRDVVFIAHPYFFSRSYGSTHGWPYAYDTHVPQVWFGAGVPQGARVERVGVEEIATTLAGRLGIPAPPEAMGRRLF